MQIEMKNEKTNDLKVFGQDNLRITCVERKYKVSNSKIEYIVIAKKELDENITQELLHEDMELRTFLEKYEIAEVLSGENVSERKISTSDSTRNHDRSSEGSSEQRHITNETMRRRGLFDSLNLPETFLIKDYKKALEDIGVKITNSAMPYDDLNYFEKQGKIVRIGRGGHGAVSFTTKKKEIEIAMQ